MKLNHAFDIAFSIETEHDRDNVTAEELLKGLKARVAYFEQNPQELIESCGYPFDTYEVDQ